MWPEQSEGSVQSLAFKRQELESLGFLPASHPIHYTILLNRIPFPYLKHFAGDNVDRLCPSLQDRPGV